MMTKMESNQNIKFVIVGRDADVLLRKSNMAMFTASQFGLYPKVSFEVLDLTQVDALADLFIKHKPDVVFNSASIQSWRIVTELPTAAYRAINAAYLGPWLPMHLSLVYCISKALKMSGQTPFFINSAFPDIVNPVLSKINLSPDIGIGNVANVIPALRFSTAEYLKTSPKKIRVRCVAHHYISHYISRHGYPDPELFDFSVELNGKDVTKQVDQEKIFSAIPIKFRRLVGLEGQPMTATSAIKVIMAALHEKDEYLHAPGPKGLPGGYPVRIQEKKVALDLPSTLSIEKAIQINKKAQHLEGVSHIENDGTIHFTPENMEIMRKILGYECLRLKIEDSYEYAMELKKKYIAFSTHAHQFPELVGR